MSAFEITASEYKPDDLDFEAGQPFGNVIFASDKLAVLSEQQVLTTTIDDPADGDKTIEIESVTYTYTASSETTAQIAAGFAALLNADSGYGERFYATATATEVVHTSWAADTVHAFTGAGTDTTTTETNAAGGDTPVSPGRFFERVDPATTNEYGETEPVRMGFSAAVTEASAAGVSFNTSRRGGELTQRPGEGVQLMVKGDMAVEWSGVGAAYMGAVWVDAQGIAYAADPGGGFQHPTAAFVKLNHDGTAGLVRIP